MINVVTVVNHLGERLKMELRNPEPSGFLISNIDGITPGDAEISTTELAATDGSVYNSARLTSREITMNIIFYGQEPVEDLRHKSYRYFPLKKEVKLIFETDNRSLQIDGYVKTNEADIFSQQEGTSITINCPNPYFYSLGQNATYFSGIEPMFEFPFCNDSLTEKLLVFSEIRNKYENVIFYQGDAETGVVMKIHFVGPAKDITIFNVTSREVMKINTTRLESIVGSAIVYGDDLYISTIRGSKSLTFLRNGKEYNVLNALDRGSQWITLDIGENVIAFTADEGDTNMQFEVYNDVLYGGV